MHIRRMSALLLAVLLVFMFGGCGGVAEPEEDPGDQEGPSEAVETEPGDETEKKTLYIGQSAPPKNLNTFLSDYTYDAEAVYHVYARLAQFRPDGEVDPYLADWTISDDGLVYTFNIHPDAVWHDGEPVTARDVAYTFELAANPNSGSVWFSRIDKVEGVQEYHEGQADSISGIEIIDDKTLQVTLEEIEAAFVAQLTLFMNIVPEHILGSVPWEDLPNHRFWQEPIGAGPYRLVQYRSDQFIHLEKFPDFFLGEPNIDEIYIRLGNWQALQAAFEAGDIDVVRVESSELPNFEAMDGVKLFRAESTVSNLMVNNRSPFLGDVRVRKAIMHAMDRETMAEGAYMGMARVVHNAFDTPWTLSPNITTYSYDPDRAMQLLEEAGWDGSVTYKIVLATGNPERERAVLILQQNLQDVGIETEIVKMEGGTALDEIDAGNYDLAIVGFGTMSLLPDTAIIYMGADAMPPNGFNSCFYEDWELTDLLKEVAMTTDPDARTDLYHQITEIATDRLPYLPVVVQQDVVAINTDRVQLPGGFEPVPRNRPGGDTNFVTWDIINWDIVD
ncbi:MAG: ABC transporter substrate-binding protein [Bacillota bacterium]